MNNNSSRIIHLGLTIIWLLVSLWMIFFYAPQEATMGEVQRIFYIHVPAAWTWDARLTASFLLWLLYISYLMLRSYVINPGRSAVLSAVVGIIGFVDVPINYMAIRWWRTQHPQPVIGGGDGSGMAPAIGLTLYISLGAFTCLFSYLVRERMALGKLRHELSALRRGVEGATHG